MAIGSRRVTPTAPVAAAVVSEAIVAPTKTPCCQLRDSYTSGANARAASAENNRGDGNALRILPVRRNRRRLLRRDRVTGVRMRGWSCCRASRARPSSRSGLRRRAVPMPSHHGSRDAVSATFVKIVSWWKAAHDVGIRFLRLCRARRRKIRLRD